MRASDASSVHEGQQVRIAVCLYRHLHHQIPMLVIHYSYLATSFRTYICVIAIICVCKLYMPQTTTVSCL